MTDGACSSHAGLAQRGRRASLQTQFLEAKMHIIGIQEARSDGPSSRQNANFLIIASGCCRSTGSHGLELWVAKSIPITNKKNVLLSLRNL